MSLFTAAAEVEPAPGEAAIARARYHAFGAIRIVTTVLGVPNAVAGLLQIAATPETPPAAYVNPAVQLAVIASTWVVDPRHHRRAAAVYLAALSSLAVLGVHVVGFSMGIGGAFSLAAVTASVFFGTRAGLAAWALGGAVLGYRVAWVWWRGPSPLAMPGAIVGDGPSLLRFALGSLTVTGTLLALVSSVVRGLEEASVELGRALLRERAERTARLEAERARLRGRQLEELGRLARGVAHDTNNALVALQAGVAELRDGAPASREVIADMEHAVAAARETMRQLGALGRRATGGGPTALVAGELVERLGRAFRRLCPENVAVSSQVLRPGPLVADGPLLEQALLNLCLNARDALPSGGRIDLRVDEREREGRGWVAIEVADDGPGIPDEVRQRLFEPGVTTKPADQGSGLGLSMVKRFVQAAGGDVEIDNGTGRGTCVRLLLPRASAGPLQLSSRA